MPTIKDGRRAIEEGNPQQARLIFEAILQDNKRDEEAWLGLAEVLTKDEDKRICYENVLKINKNNREAKEALRNLEPQANPFVQALQPAGAAAPPVEETDSADADETVVATRPPKPAKEAVPSDGPPTPALIVLGLALSVVAFFIFSIAVYFVLDSLASL
jgi:thioredoxin-like negative regulator of GroEL